MAASARLRSCSDQKQMQMRKTRVRERRPRIEPTSRPSDLVCLLFSHLNCDARSNFVQAKVVDRAEWIMSSNNLASSGESLVLATAEADLRTERSSALCACAACSTVVRYSSGPLFVIFGPPPCWSVSGPLPMLRPRTTRRATNRDARLINTRREHWRHLHSSLPRRFSLACRLIYRFTAFVELERQV